jgi:hypothetical protein
VRRRVNLRRLGCLLAIGIALAALGAPAALPSGEAHAASVAPAAVAPPAAIDLHGLFGDENEPDENEGGGDQSQQGPGVSLPVVLLLVVVAALVGGYVALRVRRLWLRLRDWGSDMRARARL